MIISQEMKQKIYKQIDDFNNAPSNPEIENSKPVVDAYLYVNHEIAVDRADFFRWLLQDSKIDAFKDISIENVLDLAFGSGNLTSHIVLDAQIDYKTIYLNDKVKDNTNQNIEVPQHEIMDYDFLDYCSFQKKFTTNKINLLIFNPQIGGSYTKGKFEPEENTHPFVYDGNLLDYLSTEKKVDISKDKIKKFHKDHLIYFRTLTHTKKQIENWIGKSLFNYNDIAYHPKMSKNTYIFGSKSTHEDRQRTKVSMLRNSIDSVLHKKHIIVFYGKRKHFDLFFADYNFVVQYRTGDKGEDLFIAIKSDREKKLCFEKREGVYSECEETGAEVDFSTTKVKSILDDLNNDLAVLKSIEGEELVPLKSSEGTSEKKPMRKKKPFKNFLLEDY
jgi:hypothetical protein